MEHFAFPGDIDFAADDRRIFMSYSWKAHVFIHLWNSLYNRWIMSNFPFRWQRTASTTSGWKSSTFYRNSSGERQLKFITIREDGDNQKLRAKHREHCLTHSKGNNCQRFKKRWGDQAMLTVYSKIIFFNATIGSSSYTICTMHVRSIFPTD